MTPEEKSLLLQDLCARLPYGLICDRLGKHYPLVDIDIKRELVYLLRDDNYVPYSILRGDIIKPYLRSLSSMTEEEREELEHLSEEYFGKALDKQIQESFSSNRNESRILEYIASSVIIDWLNKHHFDYRNLIEKGLAIAVTKENNPYK